MVWATLTYLTKSEPIPDFLSAFLSNLYRIFNRFRFITVYIFGWDFLFPGIFGGVFGANDPQYMSFGQCDPKKDHPCAKPRRLSHKPWKSIQRFGLGAISRKKNGYIHTYIRMYCTFSLYFTPTWGAQGLADLNQIWHAYRSRRRNQFCQISSRSNQGFLCGEGMKMGLFPLPANTPLPLCIALPCMQVISGMLGHLLF